MNLIFIGLVALSVSPYTWANQSTDVNQTNHFDGYYERYIGDKLDSDSADIEVIQQENGDYLVSGSAVWVMDVSAGSVNVGDIYGVFPLEGNRLQYDLNDCQMTLTFTPQALVVSDDNLMCGGMNVSFNGTYRKNSNEKIGKPQ